MNLAQTLLNVGKGIAQPFTQFGKVTKKTGTFYEVDNGNRVTTVYVDANQAQLGR